MMNHSMPLQHYLLTVDLIAPPGMKLHGYLMTDDQRAIGPCLDRMYAEIERRCWRDFGIVLQTKLDQSGINVVRAILDTDFPLVKERLAKAKNFHWTAWAMLDGDPRTKQLMELH